MTKKDERLQVYAKYNGHCAYCGREIAYHEMQVDHISPRWKGGENVDNIENKNPSCRRCNHYKRGETLEQFRKNIMTLHERTRKIYINKVAEDFNIITIRPFDGLFYFERV